jgi:hypothetical protein
LEYLDIDRRIILKWIFKQWDGRTWTGLFWFWIEFRFPFKAGEDLLAFQKGLCSMELDTS